MHLTEAPHYTRQTLKHTRYASLTSDFLEARLDKMLFLQTHLKEIEDENTLTQETESGS